MPVTLTDINHGTIAGDDTGWDAFTSFQTINTNNATLEAAIADLADTETISGLWSFSHASGIKTDVISERSAAAGVTVDGVLLKDSTITGTLQTAAQPNITSVGILTGFTSTGIDDNATAERLQISDTELTFGDAGSGTTMGVRSANATGVIDYGAAGGSAIRFFGGSHGQAGWIDFFSPSGTTVVGRYNGSWDFQDRTVKTTGQTVVGTVTSGTSKLQVGSAATPGLTYAPGNIAAFESNTNSVISIISPNTATCRLYFGDTDSNNPGAITYTHTDDTLSFTAGSLNIMSIDGPNNRVTINYGRDFRTNGGSLIATETASSSADSELEFYKCRGAGIDIDTSPAQIVAGDDLGTFRWYGRHATAFVAGASQTVTSTTNTGNFEPTMAFVTGTSGKMTLFADGHLEVYGSSGDVSIGWTPDVYNEIIHIKNNSNAGMQITCVDGTDRACVFQMGDNSADGRNILTLLAYAGSHATLANRAYVQASDGVLTLASGGTNSDLELTPQGTGRVRFGSFTAGGGETYSGYIEIKDAGGTTRKVAVFA